MVGVCNIAKSQNFHSNSDLLDEANISQNLKACYKTCFIKYSLIFQSKTFNLGNTLMKNVLFDRS